MNTTSILIITLCALIIFAFIFIKRINSKKDKEENAGEYNKSEFNTTKKSIDDVRSIKPETNEPLQQKKKIEPVLSANKNPSANINFSRDKKEKQDIENPKSEITDDELKASDFIFVIEDVFDIQTRGVVVTGMVYKGHVKLNDFLTLRKKNGEKKQVEVIKIEKLKQNLTEANFKDTVGIFVKGASKAEISKHDVLLSPN